MHVRRCRCIATVVVLAAAGCARGDSTREAGVPAVTGGPEMVYVCDGGVRWAARYLSLTDRSLDFVLLTGPDGTRVTLPSVLSASGVRYSDDRQLTWWTKGTSARLDRRDANGQWQPAPVDCNPGAAGPALGSS